MRVMMVVLRHVCMLAKARNDEASFSTIRSSSGT